VISSNGTLSITLSPEPEGAAQVAATGAALAALSRRRGRTRSAARSRIAPRMTDT
jgi:hypothetical protein